MTCPVTISQDPETRTDSGLFLRLASDLLQDGVSVRFRATGTSMHPTIRDGDIVVVAPVHAHAIGRGDVLLCRLQRGPTAHRVVAVSGEADRASMLRLQGDNMQSHDGLVAPHQVLGRVIVVGDGTLNRRVGRHVLRHRLRRTVGRLSAASKRFLHVALP